MRLTIIQDEIHWADKTGNLRKVENQLKALAGTTDLVVLPEMFTTGFCTDELHLAEGMDGETVKNLRRWAEEFQMAIAGSFIATENNQHFNRAFFVYPDGKIEWADKRHLFSMGGEHKHFAGGNKRMIVNYLGFNICVLVCYDVRFPVWARNVNNEYDLLIYVANFPERRIDAWDILLKARAVENQAYVCGVNRVGVDGLGIAYNGHSVLLDYQAKPLIGFADNEAGVKTYQIDKSLIDKFRQKFAFWKDADEFEIK